MATKDLHNNVHFIPVIYPVAVTAAKAADQAVDLSIGAAAGASTNLAGPVESCEFAFSVGAVTGTSPTLTPLIEESDDNSTYTTVAAADLLGGSPPVFDSTYANSVVKRGYRGTKRYVRARYSAVSGTSPNFTTGIAAVLSHVRHAPTPAGN
jgi:hypothetical protein